MKNSQNINQELLLQIDDLRSLMISAGLTHGLSSMEVLHYSRELDKLIIEVQITQQSRS